MQTLIHESIHIHQRRNKTAWDAVCAAEGWKPLGATLVPERWRERCRINPDTMMCPFWAWQDNHVPLPMFRESPKHLGDCDVQWWDRRTNSLLHDPPRSFVSRYGRSPPQSEHPYELLAVECAQKGFLTDSDVLSYLKSL